MKLTIIIAINRFVLSVIFHNHFDKALTEIFQFRMALIMIIPHPTHTNAHTHTRTHVHPPKHTLLNPWEPPGFFRD